MKKLKFHFQSKFEVALYGYRMGHPGHTTALFDPIAMVRGLSVLPGYARILSLPAERNCRSYKVGLPSCSSSIQQAGECAVPAQSPSALHSHSAGPYFFQYRACRKPVIRVEDSGGFFVPS